MKVNTYPSMNRSEGGRPTWGNGLARKFTGLAMPTSQTFEGSHADSREFMDFRVTEALERHGKSHFFEVIRDMTANHAWGWKESTEKARRALGRRQTRRVRRRRRPHRNYSTVAYFQNELARPLAGGSTIYVRHEPSPFSVHTNKNCREHIFHWTTHYQR